MDAKDAKKLGKKNLIEIKSEERSLCAFSPFILPLTISVSCTYRNSARNGGLARRLDKASRIGQLAERSERHFAGSETRLTEVYRRCGVSC